MSGRNLSAHAFAAQFGRSRLVKLDAFGKFLAAQVRLPARSALSNVLLPSLLGFLLSLFGDGEDGLRNSLKSRLRYPRAALIG